MRANTLVDALLELNIVNLQDVDREVNRLAASLYDARAAKWFKRVARHWLINIEWLKKPYEAPAVPRSKVLGGRSSNYYVDPSSRSDILWPTWRGEQPENMPNTCPQCKGSGQCRKCEGTGAVGQDNECPDCKGSGKCPTCHGTGLSEKPGGGSAEPYKYKKPSGREGFFAGEALASQMLEAEPGYDPKKRTYTTMLHAPQVDKDIQQNFSRFYPKKAKAKRLHGEAPTKDELQPFMKEPQAAEKEFYHFDPIQVRRRDLFNRLQELVHYLNYSYRVLQRPAELSDEDKEDLLPEEIKHLTVKRQQAIKDAQALFKQLEVMKPDDINGFRSILLKAEEFTDKVKTDPSSFSTKKSGKAIARSGNLVLRRCNEVETALLCGKKPTYNGKPETWCLHNEYNVKSYISQGPIFYVEKDGKAYVGIHPATSQCKDTQNTPIDRAPNGNSIADEIAPLLVRFPSEIPADALANDAENVATRVEKLRRAANIR